MRKCFIGSIAVGLLSLFGCADKPDEPIFGSSKHNLLLRFRFVGTDALATNTTAGKLSAISLLPATLKLREQTLDRLARQLPARVLLATNFVRAEHAALLRPLLVDAMNSPSFFELYEVPGRSPVWTFAVELDDARAAVWQTNLWQILTADPARQPVGKGANAFSGFTRTGRDGTRPFSFTRIGRWVLFGQDAGNRPLLKIKAQIKKFGAPVTEHKSAVCELDASLAKLAPLLDLPAQIIWPQVNAVVTGKADNLRTEAKLHFPKPLKLRPAPWRVPTNSIRDPLISFAAGRGPSHWLADLPMLRPLELKTTPNQFFLWSNSDLPFQLFAAVPQPESAKQMQQLSTRLPAQWNTNLNARGLGKFMAATNGNEVFWLGLPLLVPFAGSAPEPGGDFLLFGTMRGLEPRGVNTNQPPRELFAQLERPGLIYYDWEITEARLQQWKSTLQVLQMLKPIVTTGPAPVAGPWLDAIGPQLGNSITEITASSPTELHLVRNSPIGLSGVELALLARWLDNPSFPALSYPLSEIPALPGAGVKKP